MIADLQPASYETRVAILRKKAETAELEMDDDLLKVIQLIAEYNKENIRELEGAFNRIANYSKLMNAKIDKAFATKVLKEMIVDTNTELTPDRIKNAVCKYYHIKVSDIEGTKRSNGIAFPRQIAMFLCRELTDFSFPTIGNEFGGRHYSTVMHAYDKIKSEMQTEQSLKTVVDEIKTLLEKTQ